MSKKRSKSPIAESNGIFYIRVDAMMHRLIPFCDGLEVTFFGKDRTTPYLTLDAAIEWCENEIANRGGGSETVKIRDALIVIKGKVEKGMVKDG